MSRSKPLILLPGMMADRRLFRGQISAFPDLIVPAWPDPADSDTIASFAKRITVTLGNLGPCYVGGVSFGGVVALELAKHVDASGCFLISSVRSFHEFPFRYRICRAAGLLGQPTFDAMASAVLRTCRPSMPPVARRHAQRLLSDLEGRFFRWATRAILRWDGTELDAPVVQIHGSNDRTFPIQRTSPDVIVDGAGHMLIATHSRRVNDVIAQHVV